MLHTPSKSRIADGKASGKHLVELFEALARMAAELDESVYDCVVCYIDKSDEFKIGSYVPELHLVVRRVEDEDEDV
jgi:hypothetical protein